MCKEINMAKNSALLILRLVAALPMLVAHGWGKLTNFGSIAPQFPDPIGIGSQISLALAVFSEVFCAVFLVVGLFTRFASLPLIITMLVAVLIVHGSHPFEKQELGLLYLGLYLAIALLGPGEYSLDRFVLKHKK
jgi:putative oxidoreductase